MRSCHFTYKDHVGYGRIIDEELLPFQAPASQGSTQLPKRIPLDQVALLPPVSTARIFGIGRNYAAHVQELNPGFKQKAPLVFMKPDTSLLAHQQPIELPDVGRVDYEGELALVIGRGGRNIPVHLAYDHLLGITCANDVSARDLQKSDGQWIRAKGYDTFCPLGPWIEHDVEPSRLGIITRLNGRVVQEGNSSDMTQSPQELIAYLSTFCTLQPGDVILTGTPAGVGPLSAGDKVEVEIEHVGTLENSVIHAPTVSHEAPQA
jgi:2-keto-4-pentenoate hydratase/2-oxohepta-3-ene-1,7-dioic acid hydratase in catechol pathway